MKQLILLMLLLLPCSALFAQKEKADIVNGNKLYQDKKYKEAEEAYRKSVEAKNQNLAGNFNLGDALYKQKNYKDAQAQFTKIAGETANKNVAAEAYHNLGNSLLESKKLEESIDAYKKSLIDNPKDDQTRYNLAYAQKMLQKKKDQDKKDQQNKDQNKNQDKKDQNKDQQNKDQNKKDPDKKDQNKDQQNKDEDKKDDKNGQKPQPDKMSKEDAERMLDALNNQEKDTQDKLKNKKLKGVKGNISKDW